jgi:hypothetical protein
MEVIRRALLHGRKTAVTSSFPPSCYRDLLNLSGLLAANLLIKTNSIEIPADTQHPTPPPGTEGQAHVDAFRTLLRATPFRGLGLEGKRVGIMAPPSAEFVGALWGTWLTGAVAVPMALSHPPDELEYVLQDAVRLWL